MAPIELRPLRAADVASRIGEIDVSEEGDVVYQVVDGELRAVPESWKRPRDEPLDLGRWTGYVEAGGSAVGAFDGDRLVGIAVYRHGLAEETGQLAALFVDRERRRQGVARRLLADVERIARGGGARRLYVSATPSESAVGFYRSRGFEVAREVNDELFALEPEDVHLVKRLA
jgi:GNAT superfamily N-acetyltransferase